jgi:hypothetical protein
MNSTDAAMVTLTAPADADTYGRWLAGKLSGYATGIIRTGEPISDLTAEQLRDAANEILAALDNR